MLKMPKHYLTKDYLSYHIRYILLYSYRLEYTTCNSSSTCNDKSTRDSKQNKNVVFYKKNSRCSVPTHTPSFSSP